MMGHYAAIQKSIYILREAKRRFENIAVMWSMGKDSTAMLELLRMAFYGEIPFPVVHIDTGYKFDEIYDFRSRAKEWFGIKNLVIIKRETDAVPEDGPEVCCMERKTKALSDVVRKAGFDALIMSIRRDEHYMRNIERYYSPRDKDHHWNIVREKTDDEMEEGDSPFVAMQPVELAGWDLYDADEDADHYRIHPILHWTEVDVWHFTKSRGLPVNQLYFSDGGKRYRSIGCEPCTKPIPSGAATVDEIIKEIVASKRGERDGRSQDKDGAAMRNLRAMGYM